MIENGLTVTDHIVLIEGNYLLLDESGWRGLCAYCNDSLFLDVNVSELKSRILKRKARGGISKEEAKRSYEMSDEPNIRRVVTHRIPAAITLEQSGINHLIRR